MKFQKPWFNILSIITGLWAILLLLTGWGYDLTQESSSIMRTLWFSLFPIIYGPVLLRIRKGKSDKSFIGGIAMSVIGWVFYVINAGALFTLFLDGMVGPGAMR